MLAANFCTLAADKVTMLPDLPSVMCRYLVTRSLASQQATGRMLVIKGSRCAASLKGRPKVANLPTYAHLPT